MSSSCFFKIPDDPGIKPGKIVDLGIIDVCYLKLFNAQYGENSHIGKLLYNAQQQYFENRGKGKYIRDAAVRMLVGSSDADYPILGKNTSLQDLAKAIFFITSTCPCTVLDL